jgi:Animal haem peroxidase
LPPSLTPEQRFQIARRVVGAEHQFITYNEFLPALGVKLSPYGGYNKNVNAQLYTEFATCGCRAHSMVNGEEDLVVGAGRYTAAQLGAIEAMGIEVAALPSAQL